ncbi:MAG: ribosome maturation factor RimM [Bacteroidota bacterium]|nr:ribosome maturation factor RimM [Bacteroidota bacterium]
MKKQLRAIAKLRKVFGLNGEFKIDSYSRTAEEFELVEDVVMGMTEHSTIPCKIESVKMRGEEICLKLIGVDDKTAADMLRGQFLFVEESKRKKLSDKQFFIDELIGCSVVDERGKVLGMLSSIETSPAHKVYNVRTSAGYVMLPAVPEFIVNVEIEKKKIVVRPPEGMFTGEML